MRNRLLFFLKTGLAVLVLLGSFAFAPRAEAISAAQVNGLQSLEDARDLFKIDGNDAPKFAWQPAPPPKKPTDANAKQVAIFVCEQTVSECRSNTPGAVQFRLVGVHHEDRRTGGLDTWDFVFKPYRGDTQIQTKLQVVYRANTSGTRSAGLVWGDPGDEALLQNLVGQLNSIDDTEFAEDFLDKLRNDSGLQWAKEAGLDVSTDQTSLAERASTDPFSLAIQKVAEIVTTLIGSVTSAVEWALDAGTLMDNEGLSKAWMVVRDLVNILFILVLTTMAIMSILRVEPQKYNVRQLLPLLVFSVLAVNFSFLFASVMANTAAVLSQPFLEKATAFVQEAAGVGAGYSDGLVDGFGEAVVLLIASIIILVALLILLFFLVIRIIVIWVLSVLSPVVFLFMILPLTRGESRNLLKNYIQWVYMAPIAMLLLFTGSLMLNSALQGTDTGDPGGSAILQAVFFAGITIAAVMVPIGLGGRIAQAASRHGSRAGRIGGKGGLGAAGMIPLGRGMTVGEAARTGRGYMKLRKDAQEQRGLERAAGLQTGIHDTFGNAGVATALTGRDATQAATVTEGLVDERLKRLDSIGFQDPDYLQTMQYIMASDAEKPRLAASMSADQLEQANGRVGQLATAKALAKSGWWDADIARRFGHTGYQKLSESDLAMQHLRRQRYSPDHQFGLDDFDTTGFSIRMSSIDGDGLRKIQTPFWDYMNPNSEASQAMPGASDMLRQMISDEGLEGKRFNYNALRQNLNAKHRNHAPDPKRAKHAGNLRFMDPAQFGQAHRAVLSGLADSKPDRFVPAPQVAEDYDAARTKALGMGYVPE